MSNERYDKKVIEHAKFYTLSACAWSAIADIRGGEEYFETFLKWAMDGARELNFDVLHEIHYEEIEMKPWKQIDFPCDMVDWTKIGFRCGDTVKVFTRDSSIPKIHDKVNCIPQENKPAPDLIDIAVDEIIPFVGMDDYFWPGGSHFYGSVVNHNYAGYFDVDTRKRVFNFKRTVNNINMVYLEYITDGVNYSGQTVIHPYAFQAIVKYIHWQRKENDDKYSDSQAQRAKELYEDKVDELLVRNLNLSIADIHEALRSHNKQIPKS